MNREQLFRRYQQLQSYVKWCEADGKRVRAAAAILEPQLPPLLDDFYAEIQHHAETRQVIEGGRVGIEHLKGTLRGWLLELLSGPYDQDYVARRWQVGKRHIEVGVEQVYVGAALAPDCAWGWPRSWNGPGKGSGTAWG
jgi:hypothetical protein